MMNAAHLHLVLNHFPVIGTMISIFVLLIGFLKRSDDIKKASALILILTALITIPVYLTGDKAQAKIEGNYEDVDEEFIEGHEEFALYSFIAMDIIGAVALGALIFFRKPKTLPNSLAVLLLIMLLIVNGMMGWTANLGGKIHHPEIREDSMPWESPTKKANENKDDKGDDKGDEDKNGKESKSGKGG